MALLEQLGEVVVGEEGFTKGWTVVRWKADLPPIAVGTKLYSVGLPQMLTPEQIGAVWSAQGSFTDRESDYRSFARACIAEFCRINGIGVTP